MDGENETITKKIIAVIPSNIFRINLGWFYEKYNVRKENEYKYSRFYL